MQTRHLAVFILLGLWQVAPVGEWVGGRPRWRAFLGSGTSSFDYSYWMSTCEGEPQMYSSAYEWHAAGAAAEGWATPTVRISASLSALRSGETDRAAAAVAMMVSRESRNLGIGFGWNIAPRHPGEPGPSFYARIGPLDSAHARVEVRPPTAAPGPGGWARAGLAWNQGGRRGFGFFGGAAVVAGWDGRTAEHPPATERRIAPFADVSFGLGLPGTLALRLHWFEHTRGFSATYSLNGPR